VKPTIHDRYVRELCSQIGPSYDFLLTNVPLFRTKQKKRSTQIGEIDVLAVKDDRYDVYEVKCSYRVTKARKQLKRIRKKFPVQHTFCFFGESKIIELIE